MKLLKDCLLYGFLDSAYLDGRDPEFFSFYRSMEAYKKSFNQEDTMVLNPSGDFFKFFQLPEKK